MRFPEMEYMDRVIGNANNSLIPYINSLLTPEQDAVVQIPYFFTAQNTFRRYNDILAYNQQPPTADIFHAEPADGGTVDAAFATVDPGTFWFNVTRNMTDALTADFSQGFNQLMDFDAQSIRAYLLAQGYSNHEVDWTETINDATGHWDMHSMSQRVLEEWIFTEAQNWTCINGGMDRITYGMTEIIKNKPIIGSHVTAIKPDGIGGLTVIVNGTQETNYAHVISTLPLGALQIIDLTETDLNYTQRNAIRKLNYDPGLKIGMKFKTRRWENLPARFIGGQSYSDLPIRRCVYPSYGVNLPNSTAPGTMIASYVWAQVSSRLGAYMYTLRVENPRVHNPSKISLP